MQYADGIILASPGVDRKLTQYAVSRKIPVLPYINPQDPSSNYIRDYDSFYDQILDTQ